MLSPENFFDKVVYFVMGLPWGFRRSHNVGQLFWGGTGFLDLPGGFYSCACNLPGAAFRATCE